MTTARVPGTVLSRRRKGGGIEWQARISADRGTLEVVAIVPASDAPTELESLTERELLELLGEDATLDLEAR